LRIVFEWPEKPVDAEQNAVKQGSEQGHRISPVRAMRIPARAVRLIG